MPIGPASKPAITGLPEFFPEPEEEEGPSALNIVASAARRESLIGSYDVAGRVHAFFSGYDYEPEFPAKEGYDAIDDIIGTKYETIPEFFDDSYSPEQTAYKKTIADQRWHEERTANTGWLGALSRVFYGATSVEIIPFMLAPLAASATRLGSAAKAAGIVTVEAGVQEAALHQLDPTRTAEESIFAMTAGAAMGGVLGAAVGPTLKALPNLQKAAQADVEDVALEMKMDMGGDSVGAARVAGDEITTREFATPDTLYHPDTGKVLDPAGVARLEAEGRKPVTALEAESLVGTGLNKTAKIASPAYRVLDSASIAARQLGQQLVNIPARLKKYGLGFTRTKSIESKVHDWRTAAQHIDQEAYGHLKNYKKRVPRKERMKDDTFWEAVHVSMIKGDVSAVPEVQAAVKSLRKYYDEVKFRGEEYGVFDEGMVPRNAKGYAPIKYDVFKIEANPTKFDDFITNQFMRQQGMDEHKARQIAEQIRHSILGIPDELLYRQSSKAKNATGFLQHRKVTLDHESLLEWTINDARLLLKRHVDTVAPELEMRAQFGSVELGEQIQIINKQFGDQIKVAERAGNQRLVNKLVKQRKKNVDDIEAMRDRILGTYGQPADPTSTAVRGWRFVRGYNYLTMGGNFGLSSLPELGKALGDHGIWRGLKSVSTQIDSEIRSMTRKDAERFSVGLEMVVNGRAKTMYDFNPGVGGIAGKVMSGAGEAMAHMSGLSAVTHATRVVAGVAASDEMSSLILKASKGRLNKAMRTQLADGGIPEAAIQRIADQLNRHAKRRRSVRIANLDEWDDAQAANLFENAVRYEVARAAPTGSVGMTPNFMDKEWGKVIAQFKRFFFMSLPAHGLTALSRRNMNSAVGVISAVYTAYWSAQLRAYLNGYEINDDWRAKSLEAVDQSGITGMLMEVWNTTDRLLPFLPGPSDITGQPLSRYQASARNQLGTLAGPSLGRFETAWTISAGIGDGEEATQAELKARKRMVPWQNYAGVRQILDYIMGIEK